MLPPILADWIYSDAGISQTPTTSGGSWLAGMPFANVQSRKMHLFARSTNALAASTQREFDLGVARPIRALAALLPNISKTGATIRWRGSSTAGTFSGGPLVYDSQAEFGSIPAWPTGVTAEGAQGYRPCHAVVPAAVQTARYWLMEIVDTANTDGYVDVARVGICGGFQPSTGISYGAKSAVNDSTERHETEGRATVFNEKIRLREELFALNNVPSSDAYQYIRAMQMRLGLSGQLFFVFNPADTTNGWRQNMFCTMRELGPLEWTHGTRQSIPFALIEESYT